MSCPRCTHEIPGEARYCPACGLDLERVEEEAAAAAAAPPPVEAGEYIAPKSPVAARDEIWPWRFRIQQTRGGKRPYLAVTLAFFFGPFVYLYLEQSAWFWWGLLGGLLLIIASQFNLLPLLVIGFMLHAYDVATILSENDELLGLEV